jgi:hypothetical protein
MKPHTERQNLKWWELEELGNENTNTVPVCYKQEIYWHLSKAFIQTASQYINAMFSNNSQLKW